MPVEKSAGAVVFYRAQGKIEYLLLKHQAGHWAFPKGLIEEGEKLEDTAAREIREESGITDIEFVEGFKYTEKYYFKVKYDYQLERGLKKGEGVMKFVTYFLAQAPDREVKLSHEHDDFAWLEYKDALDRITYKGGKEVLKKANDYLVSKKSL